MPTDYANPSNINEGFSAVRDQSGPQDLTASGINFHRQAVSSFITTAFDLEEWEETKYGNPRTTSTVNNIQPSPARDVTKQAPFQILSRHGTIIMTDSTPFYERHAIYFRSGSYLEFTNEGTYFKSRGDYHHIVTGDEMNYTKGKQSSTIDGERWLLVKEDGYIELKKNRNEKIHQDIKREVLGSIMEEVGDLIEQKIGSKKTIEVPEEVHVIEKSHKLQSQNDTIEVNCFKYCPAMGLPHAGPNTKVRGV